MLFSIPEAFFGTNLSDTRIFNSGEESGEVGRVLGQICPRSLAVD